MTAPAARAGTVLAKTGEAAKAGPIGLVVILLLCIVCYFLFKSMSKHMRNVRENFPADAPGPTDRPPARPSGRAALVAKPTVPNATQPNAPSVPRPAAPNAAPPRTAAAEPADTTAQPDDPRE